jgi:hypothetical protein
MSPHVYEVNIQVTGADQYYQIDHRFPALPEIDTLVALKDEAVHSFGALFDVSVDEIGVHVIYLSADERDADGERETANRP